MLQPKSVPPFLLRLGGTLSVCLTVDGVLFVVGGVTELVIHLVGVTSTVAENGDEDDDNGNCGECDKSCDEGEHDAEGTGCGAEQASGLFGKVVSVHFVSSGLVSYRVVLV